MYLKIKDELIKIFKIIDKDIVSLFLILILSLESLIIGSLLSISNAEQMGSSPDTGGAQSVVMRSYNTLVSKGDTYGSSSSPDWTSNWGTYWNRIMYSAAWEPDGTATTSDVLSGKTFYSGTNNRTIQTGTFSNSIDYALQQFDEFSDDSSVDYTGDESSWTSPATNVWLDTRTGLYWSNRLTTYSNSFSSPSSGDCDFFNTGTYPTRGSYGTSETDPACGAAINACAVLTLTSGGTSNTDWYLPSQKELLEAYADGMYNQAGSTFTTSSVFWSSTERAGNNTQNFGVALNYGFVYYWSKATSYNIRCVRRD